MKLLHISHHVGCMRDHAYVYDKLGFEYEFWKFYNGLFKITKEVADRIWNEKKDHFNSFDYIVTSDTAPLSRIFMENIAELKPKVVVWICNRFDYDMETDRSFYEIFNKIAIEHKDKFKIVPYSDFEARWCQFHKIDKTNILPTITPIGIQKKELDNKIDSLDKFKEKYVDDDNSKEHYKDPTELVDKMFIPIYCNDNKFFPLKHMFQHFDIPCFNGGYEHPSDLKNCKGLVTFPDAFSKLIVFETIQNEVIVFLPSPAFLIQLHPLKNNVTGTAYWFNSPIGLLDYNTIQFCEWYKYENCRIYFDSIDDLIHKIKTLTPEIIEEKKKWCRIYGEILDMSNVEKWRNVFSS